ncbi:MAG: hypothetical protein IT362_04160 [Deltaproteobacteria bacterium]|nr:hypothetical protein [Deltaproteobacteria bacterium]
MAERNFDSGMKGAVAAAEDGLLRLSNFSVSSTLKYTTSVSRAFNELKKDIERLADSSIVSAEYGADRVEKLRQGHVVYMEERARQASQERAFEEARYSDLEELDRSSWAIRAGHAEAGAAMMSNTFQNLFVATGSKHRAMFEAMKAFAVAETVIQTYRAAQGAYASLSPIPVVGPALGAAAAAAAIAAGLARVEQIRSTGPGGATGTISASGRANPQYSGGSPGAYPAPSRLEDARPSQYITVQIYNPLSEQNWQKIVEDNIVPALRDAGDRNIAVNMIKMV